MAVIAQISPIKYGKLLARTLPKVIETREEFDRYVQTMEELDRRTANGKELSPEEETLLALLEQLVQDYDDKIELPEVPPNELTRFLMDQRGLRQTDLVEVIGSRAQVSDLLSGRRGISKAQAKRLAEFFRVPADLFI
ncbi:MAG: helix-turn-helix domain-containing protein [Bryobacteraceae bacterium]|jgi:HTH-type transcriptional regulator/antitoxin HigA